MKIKTLIQKLSKLDQESEVFLASDEEGNSFSKLEEIDAAGDLRYINHDGEIEFIAKDDIDNDFLTEKEYNKGKKCIILFPV